jgi:hypothetical protein
MKPLLPFFEISNGALQLNKQKKNVLGNTKSTPLGY